MLIIVITLIREVLESLGGMYVVKQMWSYDPVTRKTSFSRSAFASYVWVTAIVAWNNILGIYLLYASFRRMINAPNDIWVRAFIIVHM